MEMTIKSGCPNCSKLRDVSIVIATGSTCSSIKVQDMGESKRKRINEFSASESTSLKNAFPSHGNSSPKEMTIKFGCAIQEFLACARPKYIAASIVQAMMQARIIAAGSTRIIAAGSTYKEFAIKLGSATRKFLACATRPIITPAGSTCNAIKVQDILCSTPSFSV